jgi:AcrR family transcriptional regulator
MKKKEMLKSAYDQWITKGYEHFSNVGPSQLSVRKLSVELNQPRTSFYYYFESQEEFLNELLLAHWDRVNDLLRDIQKREINSCTELFRLLENYPVALSFQNQLFKNRENEAFNNLFLKVYDALFEHVISKIIMTAYDSNISKERLRDLMLFTAEVWFSRLYLCDLSVKSKMENLQEIMKTIGLLIGDKTRSVLAN